jgi:peptide/nickel transport system substrate-binding protein
MDHIKLSIFFSLDLVAPVLNLDPERTTVFQDVNVRKALLHGLDRDLMSEAFYFGFAPPATTLLLPDGWSNDAAAVTVRYPYDPELAGQLLDEAGWVMGEDGIRVKDGQPLSFVGVAPKSVEPKLLGMQGYWQEIGVDMETQIILEEQHTEIFNSHDFDLLWLHLWMGGSGYETMRYFFDSSNYPDGGNTGKYSNPRVDELLDQIKAELDPEARIPLFTELQTIILEDLPVLPLVHDMDTRIVHTRLHNVFPNPYRTVFNAETWWVDA